MRSKAFITAIVAVGLVALSLVWWRLAGARGSAFGGTGAPGQDRDAHATLQGPVLPDRSEAELATEPLASEQGTVASPREPVALPRTALLRVVRKDSGKAVSGARAWIELETADYDGAAWRRVMRRFNDVEPVLQSGFGLEVALDERGEARVPQPARQLCVVAVLGALHGQSTLGPDDLECVVELERYRSLACEVVDSSGRPLEGALVALSWGELDPFESQWTWVTDEDGRAWIPKLEDHIHPDDYRGELRLFLAGGVPGEPECVTLDMEHLPEEPVRFVAGEHGSVVVQATDPTGKQMDLGGHAFLGIREELVPDAPLTLRAGSDIHLSLDGGRAEFACVGLGLSLDICVSAEGFENAWREVPGPQVAGETVQVLVPLTERKTIARGRVHGIEASPADAPYTFLEGRPLEGYASFQATLEQGPAFEGRVWASVTPNVAWALEIRCEGVSLARRIVTPAFDEEHGVLEFGDVVFSPGAELVRLRVVDDHGQAVASAMVHARWATHGNSLWCDEDGRCVIRGEPTELPVRVHASKEECLPSESVPVDTPGSEMSLVLRRGATLQGRIAVPRAWNLEAFDLQLTIEPEEQERDGTGSSASLVEGGRFRFAACEAGSARLLVRYGGQSVLERGDIELRYGETTELVLDLRADLHQIELSFELEGGEPWSIGALEIVEPDGALSTWTVIGPAARASFLARRPIVDVWVAGRGAQPRLFENVRSGDRLTLPSAPFLVLRVSGEIRLPEPPLALVALAERARPEDVPYETYDDLEAVVDEKGTARLRVPWRGEYELSWVVRNTLLDLDFAVEQQKLQTIHVPMEAATPSPEATLTPAEVARAVLAAGG